MLHFVPSLSQGQRAFSSKTCHLSLSLFAQFQFLVLVPTSLLNKGRIEV